MLDLRPRLDDPANRPFHRPDDADWSARGRWPARWIHHPAPPAEPHRLLFRRTADAYSGELRLTADERYRIVGTVLTGPERGHPDSWAIDLYDVTDLSELTVEVDAVGPDREYARHSIRPGLFVSGGPFDSGEGWEVRVDRRVTFIDPQVAWGVGPNERFEADAPDEPWLPVAIGESGRTQGMPHQQAPTPGLRPAFLPPEIRRLIVGIEIVADAPVPPGETSKIPLVEARRPLAFPLSAETGERRRVVLDLGDYQCARPRLTARGEGSVRIHWQESLLNEIGKTDKGDRSAVDGKFFTSIWWYTDGVGDLVLPGTNGIAWEPIKWHAGRYVELVLDGPVTIDALDFFETRYPLEREDRFVASDPSLADVATLAFRTLQNCAHDTFMDCPYYERLQYVGDTRLQALVGFVTNRDARLAENAVRAFDLTRGPSGITYSRAPSRVPQVIPEYSLWHICEVHDLAMWRSSEEAIALLPGVRAVLDHYRGFLRSDGLLDPAPGWNMIDWVPDWPHGNPPNGHREPTGPAMLQAVLAWQAAATLEDMEDADSGRGAILLREAESLLNAFETRFYDGDWLWDDLAHTRQSEHVPALALLAGSSLSNVAEAMLGDDRFSAEPARCTVYFSHYLFEAYGRIGRTDLLLKKLDLWRGYLADGLKTAIEMPEPTRSDCHAWGAHPLFHFHATLAGIRPASPDFASVTVNPCLGGLERIEGTVPHPSGGEIAYAFSAEGGTITIPDGLLPSHEGHVGWYRGKDAPTPLHPGINEVGPPRSSATSLSVATRSSDEEPEKGG